MVADKVSPDPFVVGLRRIMTDRYLSPNDLSQLSGVNAQTIRKLLRESRGSDRIRNRIATSLQFESFAEIYHLGMRRKPTTEKAELKSEEKKENADLKELYRELGKIESRLEFILKTRLDKIEKIISEHITRNHSPIDKNATDRPSLRRDL